MRIWLAVRGEGSELRIWPDPRVLPLTLEIMGIYERTQLNVGWRGGGGMLRN